MHISKYPSGQLSISDQIYHWPTVSTRFHPPNWSYSIPLNIACNRLLFLCSELHLSVWNLCQLTKNKENRKATTMFSGINRRKILSSFANSKIYYMALKNPTFWLVTIRFVKTRIRTVVRKFPYSDRLGESSLWSSELATILTCFEM